MNLLVKGVGRGGFQWGSAEPPFHFNDIHIQIFATTQLAWFPGCAHVACLTLVHLAQN